MPFLSRLKHKKVITSVLLVSGLVIYSGLNYLYGTPPLTIGYSGVAGTSGPALMNEVVSFGFSVRNRGIAPVIVESVKALAGAGNVEIIELVFLDNSNKGSVGVLKGTAQENGYDIAPVAGHVIQAGQNADLNVAFKALTTGNNSVTAFLFSYSYLGVRYSFTYYDHFEGFTITVST